MSAVLAFLVARWFLSFIGTALLAALVWFFGPFLEAFESWVVRLAIILVMFALWAGINLLLDWRRRRRDRALTEGVAAGAPDPAGLASAEEAAALRDKLTAALALLRKARVVSSMVACSAALPRPISTYMLLRWCNTCGMSGTLAVLIRMSRIAPFLHGGKGRRVPGLVGKYYGK